MDAQSLAMFLGSYTKREVVLPPSSGSASIPFASVLQAQAALDQPAFGAEAMKAEFVAWRNSARGWYPEHRAKMEALTPAYQKLLDKAVEARAFEDPQAFLKSLSAQELETLQHVHCVAERLDPSRYGGEGALNLILPPSLAQDINHDGFEMNGEARMWHFPPPNASAAVKAAWKQTTDQLSDRDAFDLGAAFMPLLSPDEEPTPGGRFYLPDDQSFLGLVQSRLEAYLAAIQRNAFPWQRPYLERQVSHMNLFMQNLQAALGSASFQPSGE